LGYVEGSQGNSGTGGGLVFPGNPEFHFLRELLGYDEGGVVEFFEDVFVGQVVVADGLAQVLSKGFKHGKDDATIGALHGIAFHKVKQTIGVTLLFGVEPIHTHHLE